MSRLRSQPQQLLQPHLHRLLARTPPAALKPRFDLAEANLVGRGFGSRSTLDHVCGVASFACRIAVLLIKRRVKRLVYGMLDLRLVHSITLAPRRGRGGRTGERLNT